MVGQLEGKEVEEWVERGRGKRVRVLDEGVCEDYEGQQRGGGGEEILVVLREAGWDGSLKRGFGGGGEDSEKVGVGRVRAFR